ncbi:MAG: hypothetical protein LHV69_08475 [Elusimicrobia bacterium]|nr:hypothetical protein [Candidatus Obscuribacterium magneticum]
MKSTLKHQDRSSRARRRSSGLSRKSFTLLSFLFLTAPLSFNQAALREWTGAGVNALASNPANWSGNVAPGNDDSVRFGNLNPTKDCLWDLPVAISEFNLTADYAARVQAAIEMDLHNVTISGGEFHMGSFEHTLSGHFTHTGGRFNADLNGTLRLDGTTHQQIFMTLQPDGDNRYESHFFNFRLTTSSSVAAVSDLIIDGTFSVSAGKFNGGSATLTMTGGSQVHAGDGSKLNWSDTGGQFLHPAGTVVFYSHDRDYTINQKTGNAFNHLIIKGSRSVEVTSDLKVNGNFTFVPTGDDVTLNLGNNHQHEIFGQAVIGPAGSDDHPSSVLMGGGSLTFFGNVSIGTATFELRGGNVITVGPEFLVTSRGTLRISGSQTGQLTFGPGTFFRLSGGSFITDGSSYLTSTLPGSQRFATELNGLIDIEASCLLSSLDKNGLRLGPKANPIQLKSLKFINGIEGGVALNFDGFNVPYVLVDSPEFDLSWSTNIRAVPNPALLPNVDIDVIYPQGVAVGAAYENDPYSIVNWGILGAPAHFQGVVLGTSSISWTWEVVNHPLGLVVKDPDDNDISPILSPQSYYWVETNLAVNTAYHRKVQAFADTKDSVPGTADSETVPLFTLANPAAQLTAPTIGISSVTLTWNSSGNPSPTLFLVERSTDSKIFLEIARGTYDALHPYVDKGLKGFNMYFYRVETMNGDGVITPYASTLQIITQPTPPPVVQAISPNTANNLGLFHFTVIGADFQDGAKILFSNKIHSLEPASVQFENATTLTGTVDLTGATAGKWNVSVENPDGKLSLGSGQEILTITDASSTDDITIKDYDPNTSFTLTSPGERTQIRIKPGALKKSRLYLTEDPLRHPLRINPVLIMAANTKLAGWLIIPGTLREIVAFDDYGLFTGPFRSSIDLGILYPDANHDGILDNLLARTESIKIMTLNEQKVEWENIDSSSLDRKNDRSNGVLRHFSVYGLFAAAPAPDLNAARLYPNPWMPGANNDYDAPFATMSGLPEAGTVKIFTIDGLLVQTLSFDASNVGARTWDGITADGQRAASGVYLLQIEGTDGNQRILKLGIER